MASEVGEEESPSLWEGLGAGRRFLRVFIEREDVVGVHTKNEKDFWENILTKSIKIVY